MSYLFQIDLKYSHLFLFSDFLLVLLFIFYTNTFFPLSIKESLSLYPPLFSLSLHLYLYLSFSLYIFFQLYIFISIYISIHVAFYPYFFLSYLYLLISLSTYLFTLCVLFFFLSLNLLSQLIYHVISLFFFPLPFYIIFFSLSLSLSPSLSFYLSLSPHLLLNSHTQILKSKRGERGSKERK